MPLPTGHYWLPHAPDWSQPVEDRAAAASTIADAITGAEERAVWMPTARRTLRFALQVMTVPTAVRTIEALRAARVAGRASVPHWGRGRLLSAYTPGSAVITTSLAHGLAVGSMAALYRPGDETARLVEVAAVASTTTLTLTSAVPISWAAGGVVWISPVLHGRIGEPSWQPTGGDLRMPIVEFTEFPAPPAPVPVWEAYAQDSSHIWEGFPQFFALFLCLDQTGSIGIGGAQRGIEIIDDYGERLGAIGLCSFGDIIVHTVPMTYDVAGVRAFLVDVVNAINPAYGQFFGDGGGDTPENGVDALAVALAEHAAFTSGLPRLIFLKTDTWGYAHHINNPATVRAGLNNIYGTWLEFGTAGTGVGDSYAINFPEGEHIFHGGFPDAV